jgi:serine phosphatase RsbU (regulator of sigma subunit)
MINRGDITGVIMVQGLESSGSPFTQRDLDLLTGLSTVAAMALQNARLYAESLKQQRLAQDLLFAEQIQKSFLPRQLPSVPGLDFVTRYQPAYSVGGDFYDVFWLTEHRLGVFIGDVAGKGVSAALLMARISSDLRVAALAESEPARVVARVNHAVLEREQHDIFVTGIYLSLDVRTRHMVLANAGHLPPLIRRRAERVVERIDGGSATAIGFFEGETYEQVELALDTGDTLVLCTDGVIEATNMTGDQFGMGRLEESMAPGPSAAEDVCARILADVRTHVGDAPVADDLTLIVCGATDRK